MYKGFAGIHYATVNNQVEVIKLLFEAEGNLLTEEDAVLPAYGIGFDEKFLLSAGSNLLHIACICDQQEAYKILSSLVAQKQLDKLYMKANCRGLNNLFIASICWRYPTGRMFFESGYVQKTLWQSFLFDYTKVKTVSPL